MVLKRNGNAAAAGPVTWIGSPKGPYSKLAAVVPLLASTAERTLPLPSCLGKGEAGRGKRVGTASRPLTPPGQTNAER